MPRKPRPLNRDPETYRDASLVVIASEDTHAIQVYFAKFNPRRVQFRVLPAVDGHSSPEAVVARLDQFHQEFKLNEDDQLWYCGDIDHWSQPNHIQNLRLVVQLCKQKSYRMALNHPCFELWLLLHFAEAPTTAGTCKEISAVLSQLAGGYSKSRGCITPFTEEMVRQAIDRAKTLDRTDDDIPLTPTARVYRILEELLRRESISLRS